MLLVTGIDAGKLITFNKEWQKYRAKKCKDSWFEFTKRKCLLHTDKVSAVIGNCIHEKVKDPAELEALEAALGRIAQEEAKKPAVVEPVPEQEERKAAIPEQPKPSEELRAVAPQPAFTDKEIEEAADSCENKQKSGLTDLVDPVSKGALRCGAVIQMNLDRIAKDCNPDDLETKYSYVNGMGYRVTTACLGLRTNMFYKGQYKIDPFKKAL